MELSKTSSSKLTIQTGAVALIVLLAAFSRIVPHMPNFSPLGGIALFGAAHFSKKWLAFVIPLIAVWLSDIFLNNVIYGQYYSEFTWFYSGFYWQYGSLLLIGLIGTFLFKKINVKRVLGGIVASSALFFLISNFGVWAGGTMYPPTLSGLMACYAAGLPFLQGTVAGDLVYTTSLFGGYYLFQRNFNVFRIPSIRYAA